MSNSDLHRDMRTCTPRYTTSSPKLIKTEGEDSYLGMRICPVAEVGFWGDVQCMSMLCTVYVHAVCVCYEYAL